MTACRRCTYNCVFLREDVCVFFVFVVVCVCACACVHECVHAFVNICMCMHVYIRHVCFN